MHRTSLGPNSHRCAINHLALLARARSLAIVGACVAPLVLAACTGEQRIRADGRASGPVQARAITHVVLISLMDPSQADALIADCNEALPRIPEVVFFGCGRPIDIGRPNVDGDYTVGVLIGFDSANGYATYLDHPLHKQLVEKWQPRWSRARIFDVGSTSTRDPATK